MAYNFDGRPRDQLPKATGKPVKFGWPAMLGIAVSGLIVLSFIVSKHSYPVETHVEQALAASSQRQAVALPRFTDAQWEAGRAALMKEPKIKDILVQKAPLDVEWQVAVFSDGTSRIGYAGYLCLTLSEMGLVDKDTDLRVVDIAHIIKEPGDFRGGSLGHVKCETGDRLGA